MSMPSASLVHYHICPNATYTPLYLKMTKWLQVLSLALASTTLTLFYSEPLWKTSPNSRKHRISLPVSLPVLLNLAVHVLSSSSSTGLLTPSIVTSRPTTASRPSNPLNRSPLAPQIRLLLTIVSVYNLYLLTYLPT